MRPSNIHQVVSGVVSESKTIEEENKKLASDDLYNDNETEDAINVGRQQ